MSAASATRQRHNLSKDGSWLAGPLRPSFASAELHVWRADLSAVGNEPVALLTASERDRAGQIARAAQRELWARGRGLLRALLGRYREADPRELVLLAGEHGKPSVQGARLEFNLSHSGTLAVYAFAAEGPVGVDVQLLRDPTQRARSDYPALARRAFGTATAERLQALTPESREVEFMRLWTRHEAALKQRGLGLSAGRSHPPPAWEAELELGPSALVGLAAAFSPTELRTWDWVGDAGR